MSKLVSEADRLLDKGKVPEAIEKLKSALKEDPLNQLVATKLANAFLANDDQDSATKVYAQLAARLSEAGKSQIAIAIYKQALELAPDDINLKVKFASECEAVGKIGDALGQASLAFQYYIRRKKFYDAANILPLMVRLQPKEEKLKLSWLEVMQLSQAEQKLVHLLVAFCGPPGVVSTEFSVGGDPATLSESLYEGLKKLVPYFPRDPKIAYAVAWAAHKRGRNADFYKYLRECLRREPDFSLAILLFSRALAENQKLNESLYIFKHMKERMPADKSVDMLTLNRLVDAFVEKNGWISFTDGMGVDELDTTGFLSAIKGETKAPIPTPQAQEAVAPQGASPEVGFVESIIATAKSEDQKKSPAAEQAMPSSEVEIPLTPASSSSGELEVEFTSAQASKKKPSSESEEKNKETRNETLKELDLPSEESTNSILLTSLIGIEPQKASPSSADTINPSERNSPQSVTTTPVTTSAPVNAEKKPKDKIREIPEIAEVEPTRPFDSSSVSSKEAEKPKFTFNPFAGNESVAAKSDPETPKSPQGEKTELFSPLDLLGASNVLKQNVSSIETKIIVNPQLSDLTAPSKVENQKGESAPNIATQTPPTQITSAPISGDPTQLFSPLEAVDAGVASRKTHGADDVATTIIVRGNLDLPTTPSESLPPDAIASLENVANESPLMVPPPTQVVPQAPIQDMVEDAATQLISSASVAGSEMSPIEDPLAALANSPGEATMIVNIGDQEKAALNTNISDEPLIASPPAGATVSVQMNPTEIFQQLEKEKQNTVQNSEQPKDQNVDSILANLINRDAPEVDATQVVNIPAATSQATSQPLTQPQDLTQVVTEKNANLHAIPQTDQPSIIAEMSAGASVDENAGPKPASLGFVKIPELNPKTSTPAATVSIQSEEPSALSPASLGLSDGIDLGDDLLDGPTRILVVPQQNEATERLFHEIKRDKKSGAQPEDKVSYMLRKGDRYLAKRNFYLARKAYRHALEFGADQTFIQEKLREIRKLEMPDSLYLSESSDQGTKEKSEDILRKLEQEFQLDLESDENTAEIELELDQHFENILRENDPKTILDFSIGLYEMALYKPAESLLTRFIQEHPEYSFDAFYLSAICKYARKDYAGAVSILRKLGSDLSRPEKEKIQIYYTLGELFEKMNRFDSSKEHFDKVAVIDSNYRSIKQKLDR